MEDDRNPGKWYSSKSTRGELSNEYQHDRVEMDSKNICVLVLWTKIASALEELRKKRFISNWYSTYTGQGLTTKIDQ